MSVKLVAGSMSSSDGRKAADAVRSESQEEARGHEITEPPSLLSPR